MAKPPKKSIKPIPTLSAEDMLRSMKEFMGSMPGQCCPEVVSFTPKADIFAYDDRVVIELDMPGVDPKEIDLSFVKNSFFVSGFKSEKKHKGKGNYVCVERGFGRFYRTIELPYPVNTKSVRAAYHNGILRVETDRVSDKRGKPKRIKITTD